MYKMELLFGVKAGLKSFNEMVEGTGMPKFYTDIQTIRLSQTIPFIPDDDALTKYCKAIKDELQKSKTFDVGEVYFKGYTYLKEV